MPDLTYGATSLRDFVRRGVVSALWSLSIPSFPFFYLRIKYMWHPALTRAVAEPPCPSNCVAPPADNAGFLFDSLVPDFSLIGVGVFLGCFVAAVTAPRLEGVRSPSLLTIALFFSAVVLVLYCWAMHNAAFEAALLDHPIRRAAMKDVLLYAVPTSVIFSLSFYASYLRDQIQQWQDHLNTMTPSGN